MKKKKTTNTHKKQNKITNPRIIKSQKLSKDNFLDPLIKNINETYVMFSIFQYISLFQWHLNQ